MTKVNLPQDEDLIAYYEQRIDQLELKNMYLISEIEELEKNLNPYIITQPPEIISVENNYFTLRMAAVLRFDQLTDKTEYLKKSHVIGKVFQTKNHDYFELAYYVSEDLYDGINLNRKKALLAQMHKEFIRSLIAHVEKKNENG